MLSGNLVFCQFTEDERGRVAVTVFVYLRGTKTGISSFFEEMGGPSASW